jgi:hypothetical protein
LESLDYDFRTRTGQLHFPAGDCCDMAGAIEVVTAIDPKAEVIRTYAGGEEDPSYKKNVGGSPDWTALPRGRP